MQAFILIVFSAAILLSAASTHANGQTLPNDAQTHFQSGSETAGVYRTEAYVLSRDVEFTAPTTIATYEAAVTQGKCKSESAVLVFPRAKGVGTVYLVCDERK